VKFLKIENFSSDESTYVLIDKNVKLNSETIFKKNSGVKKISISEITKTLDSCKILVEAMAEAGVNKGHTLIVIGGGATQDIGTLSASLYMRGLKWKYVPTTLMSMMDSCLGGKSAINSGDFKNIIGNFYPPVEILIDVELLDMKNAIALSSGVAEGLKITFAAGEVAHENFCNLIDLWRLTKISDYLKAAIHVSLSSKKNFIEVDEFDHGIRRNLNFGHTFAHALEVATKFKVPHGIAVLIGMKAAILRAGNPKLCQNFDKRIQSEIKISQFRKSSMLQIDYSKLIEAFKRDKKNQGSKQFLILPIKTGELEVCEFPMSTKNLKECAQSLYTALNELGVDFEVL
jgi:3-dehydroquinate synthase